MHRKFVCRNYASLFSLSSASTREPLNKKIQGSRSCRFPIAFRLWMLISLTCGPLPQLGGGVRRHYAAEYNSFLRTKNRFTRAQVANSRLAFFFKPR